MTVLQASDASKHIQVPSGFEDKPAASLSSNHVMSKESLQASVRSAHATTPASQAEKQPKSNDLRYRTCQRKACWLAASILELSAFQESHGQRSGGFMSGLGFQSCGGSAAGAVGAVGAGAGAGAGAAAAAQQQQQQRQSATSACHLSFRMSGKHRRQNSGRRTVKVFRNKEQKRLPQEGEQKDGQRLGCSRAPLRVAQKPLHFLFGTPWSDGFEHQPASSPHALCEEAGHSALTTWKYGRYGRALKPPENETRGTKLSEVRKIRFPAAVSQARPISNIEDLLLTAWIFDQLTGRHTTAPSKQF